MLINMNKIIVAGHISLIIIFIIWTSMIDNISFNFSDIYNIFEIIYEQFYSLFVVPILLWFGLATVLCNDKLTTIYASIISLLFMYVVYMAYFSDYCMSCFQY